MRRFRHRQSHSGIEVALANFSLTFAKALLVFCVVLFMLINPKNGQDGAKPKAEYLITVDWSVNTNIRYDVDTWTRLPDGTKVYYNNKESGIVFLERDDLGGDCHATTQNAVPTNICEEITVIRGVVAGEYQISLHLFSVGNKSVPVPCDPITVSIKIEKLNPTTQMVYQKIVILNFVRQEKPIVRFTMTDTGKMIDFNDENLSQIIYEDGSN